GCPRHIKLKLPTTLTKTKIRVRVGIRSASSQSRHHLRARTTRSTTSPSFLPRAARNSAVQSWRSKSQLGVADSVRDKRSSIRNTARELSISGKAMGKTRRLRYNSHASV